jgi:carbamate kinase
MIAELAADHEVAIVHDLSHRAALTLELALQNGLPEREVVTVLTQVVVSPERSVPPSADSASADAQAIVELRSLRTLLDSGAVVICVVGGGVPVAVDLEGSMRSVDARTDRDQTASLMARRLDADLLLLLTDAEPAATRPKADAALRFVDSTGRRAAIGALTDAAWTSPPAAGRAPSSLASAASAAARPRPRR